MKYVKSITFILILALIFGISPTGAFAQETDDSVAEAAASI